MKNNPNLVLHYLSLPQLYELRHFCLVSEKFAKLHRTPPFFIEGYPFARKTITPHPSSISLNLNQNLRSRNLK